jgi:hypothetical protein
MLESQQDNRGVQVATAVIAGPLHQALDLALGEAFAGATMGVGYSALYVPNKRFRQETGEFAGSGRIAFRAL